MDKITKYRQIIRQLILEYATHKPANGEIEPKPVIDPERDYYGVMYIGWDGDRRVDTCLVHIDIIGDKVWIQYDGTSTPNTVRLNPKSRPELKYPFGTLRERANS